VSQDSHLAATYDRVAAHLVGRERELTLVLAAVAAGRDIVLAGPPGAYTDVAPALGAIFTD
jgi:MoxR-like ATPase